MTLHVLLNPNGYMSSLAYLGDLPTSVGILTTRSEPGIYTILAQPDKIRLFIVPSDNPAVAKEIARHTVMWQDVALVRQTPVQLSEIKPGEGSQDELDLVELLGKIPENSVRRRYFLEAVARLGDKWPQSPEAYRLETLTTSS